LAARLVIGSWPSRRLVPIHLGKRQELALAADRADRADAERALDVHAGVCCGHDPLWSELSEQPRTFEVVVTVPRSDGGEPPVPCTLPAEVLGCWSADQVVVSVT
jgi:hypothetical protein